MGDHTTLHVNCHATDKHAWVLSARICGMSLEDWVAFNLNSAAANHNPAWLGGLSERTRIGLLQSGFTSKKEIKRALENPEFSWLAIPNFGPRCKREIEEWIKND